MKEAQTNQQILQVRVLDTTEKYLKAASIDQSSLCNALLNLAQCLRLNFNLEDSSSIRSINDQNNNSNNNGGDDEDDDNIEMGKERKRRKHLPVMKLYNDM